jgi:site-specific DNA-cytosine methylase
MNILVACEESGIVTDAFLRHGHDVVSCDLLPTSGKHPDRHIQGDVLPLLDEVWDMIIAFPPCTHLAASGARWFPEKRADGRQQRAVEFFLRFVDAPCEMVAIENPIGIMSTVYRKPDQIIQPWQFGHGEQKSTCLWLRGLPKLKPTRIMSGREHRIWRLPPSENRSRLRSRTFPGIADAMAEQWGCLEIVGQH